MTPYRARILKALERIGRPALNREVARIVDPYCPSTVSGSLKQMWEAGMIDRTPASPEEVAATGSMWLYRVKSVEDGAGALAEEPVRELA
jgi:predicted transcriptional regulator